MHNLTPEELAEIKRQHPPVGADSAFCHTCNFIAALEEAWERIQGSVRLGHTCCRFFPKPVCPGWSERDALLQRVEALEGLIVCYRLGKPPDENLFKKLDRTRAALCGEEAPDV